jgi:hypothetical protein
MVSGWHKLTVCELSEKQASIELGPIHSIFDVDEATGAVPCLHTKYVCFQVVGGDAGIVFCAPDDTDPSPDSIRLRAGDLYIFQVSHGDCVLATSDTQGTKLAFWNA